MIVAGQEGGHRPRRMCAENYWVYCMHVEVTIILKGIILYMTNKCTIISQMITFPRVSTLCVILRERVINALPSYTSISNADIGNTI
jgi:hypothetical protein